MAIAEDETSGGHRQESTQHAGGMENGLRPGAGAARKHFRYQGAGYRPFPADSERQQKTIQDQLPPRRGERRYASKERVGEDGVHHRFFAADAIAQYAEEDAAQRAAKIEGTQSDIVVKSDSAGFAVGR